MSCSIFDNVKVGIETNANEILALGEWVYVGYTEVDESLVEIIIAGFFEAYLQIGDRHPEFTNMFGVRFSGIILQWCAEHNLHFYYPDSE